MKLTDLEPHWYTFAHPADGVVFYLGITFLCPKCRKQRLSVEFKNPVDPHGFLQQRMVWKTPERGWERRGETFETLTLAPSIDARGHWHGHLCDGFISVADGQCKVD